MTGVKVVLEGGWSWIFRNSNIERVISDLANARDSGEFCRLRDDNKAIWVNPKKVIAVFPIPESLLGDTHE